MLLGALAQSVPDVDFVAAFWSDPASNLLAHRGFTHSLLFCALITVFLALLAEHYHRKHKIKYTLWLSFFGAELFVHLFTDSFNTYGLGLFEPFSHLRFSFNAMFVVDPFFSIGPGVACMVLLLMNSRDGRRKYWARAGFGISACYLFYCAGNKWQIERSVKEELASSHIAYSSFLTTPTPLNNWLWYIVVKDSRGYYVGFKSVLSQKHAADFHYFLRNDTLLRAVSDHEEMQKLLRFSQGYYTVAKDSGQLVFNDLRFGQIIGWYDPREAFVFHFYLMHPASDNRLVVQRGRFAKWNKQTTLRMLHRILGKE